MGLYPKDIFLISAAKKKKLDTLIDYLNKHSQDQDVYFVGTTNVGKSTLINAIIDEMGDVQDLITTSRFPGTTLDQIEIPLDNGHFLVDTPGILTDKQLASRLDPKDLDLASPKKPLKPATYQLLPGNTIFLAGLGRIDYLKGRQPALLSMLPGACTSTGLRRRRLTNFTKKHVGELLSPPGPNSDLPPLKGQEYSIKYRSDVLFAGVGFITVPEGCVIKAYTPGGIGLGTRRALI